MSDKVTDTPSELRIPSIPNLESVRKTSDQQVANYAAGHPGAFSEKPLSDEDKEKAMAHLGRLVDKFGRTSTSEK